MDAALISIFISNKTGLQPVSRHVEKFFFFQEFSNLQVRGTSTRLYCELVIKWISILSTFLDHYGQFLRMKFWEVVFLAGQPEWPIAAAESKFLHCFTLPCILMLTGTRAYTSFYMLLHLINNKSQGFIVYIGIMCLSWLLHAFMSLLLLKLLWDFI